MRYLTSALVAEGESDELFLEQVLFRQLSVLATSAQVPFEIGVPVIAECRTIVQTRTVQDECKVLTESCDVVFVHHDYNERAKFAPLELVAAGTSRLVHVVPIRETEAWMVADPEAFDLLRGSDRTDLPFVPARVEQLADPKAVLKVALGKRPSADTFRIIGENISLDRLAQVPAYQLFLQDLTTALKELNFQ